MRIGIDARFLTHPQKGGFKTYTENLVRALAEVDHENEYFLYLDRQPVDKAQLPSFPNIHYHIVPGTSPFLGMPWREQVGLPHRVRLDRLDLFHSPSLTAPLRLSCPLVLTIHDTIWWFPVRFALSLRSLSSRQLMRWYYRLVPEWATRHAALVITVSQAAKEMIVQHFDMSNDQVVVTHEAAGGIFRQIEDRQLVEEVRKKYILDTPFILGIGSADPRKNMATLVQAYARVVPELREKYHLAIVWTHHLLTEDIAEQVEELNLSRYVHFLRNVSNEDLVLLYNAAALFVFPSRYEGFGLPPLEAMACGAPVISANNSSLPEIVGDAALLVDAEDMDGMAATITRVLTDQAVQRTLQAKGLARAAHFSWEKCAMQTLDAYQQVINRCSEKRL